MNTAVQGKLVLIDGSSYLYRAFHALPPLTNSKGEPTGAILGVTNMLLKLIKEEQPDFLAVVFDAPGKTFRDELFAEYKAQRPPMPDELRAQTQPLLDMVAALGLPLLRVEGVEADDVIGSLAQQATQQNLQVLISTGDKDMAQLVNEQVTLINTMTGTRLDRAGVKAKFDVYPEQIIDYLALVGDSADNIPGVPKVGPKTAAKWLTEFNTLDALLAQADRITGKVGESLRAHVQDLTLSRQLARIDCALPLTVTPTSLQITAQNTEALRTLLQRLEFNSLLRQLGLMAMDAATPDAHSTTSTPTHYETVLTLEQLQQWIDKLELAPLCAIDTETTSLDYMSAELVGISLAITAGEAAYIPVAHDYPDAPKQLTRAQVLNALRPILTRAQPAKVGHHLKYDLHIFSRYDIALQGVCFDSMLESYVVNSTATRHDMDSVARKYLNLETIHYEDVTGKGAKQIGFSQVSLDSATRYAAEDADITLRLHQTLWPQITHIPQLQTLYETIEQPLMPVLQRMEHTGVLIDADALRQQSHELAAHMDDFVARCHAAAGQPFNLDSPKQLQAILFGKLGIPVLRKTPTGQASTAEDVLEELADTHELPRLILEYRGLAKLKSTYTDKLPQQINPHTGRVHTSYHQAVAATGRLSSTDPNLQNIPIRNAAGRRIRQSFIAPPNHVLVAADYSQIELRIMAHLSEDAGLLAAFTEDRDIHQATAAEVFAVPLHAVSTEQRRAAKAINFGLIYGMSAFGLSRQLGLDRHQAQHYIELYFQRYPGVRRYMDNTREQARAQGFVETLFGRRLYLPDIQARNSNLRQYAERSAINAPMQGTAADIIKRAMINIDQWLLTSNIAARLIMQVHDELVFEVRTDLVETVSAHIRTYMGAAAALKVPLKVDIGYGPNWDEAH